MPTVVGVAAFLVVVSGLPASGKSTLSARLGRDLSVPVVQRDRLRRQVFAELAGLPGAPELIPGATTRMVLAVLDSILDAGGGAILDGNFNTEQHAAPLRDFARTRSFQTIEICLWGDASKLRRRFTERADPPLTADLEPYFEAVLHRPRHPVLMAPALVEHFDTTDFAKLDSDYPALLGRITAATA